MVFYAHLHMTNCRSSQGCQMAEYKRIPNLPYYDEFPCVALCGLGEFWIELERKNE
jgi:hypothetical protein